MKVIVGPCPCRGCGASVYWGRRVYKKVVTGDPRWRDVGDEMPHVCIEKGER